MRAPVLISVLIALLAVACGDDKAPSSPSSTTPTVVTERFDAIVELKGTAFFPFSVNQNGGSTAINFASLSPLNRPGALIVSMQIGYGTVVTGDDGTPVGCEVKKTVDVTPALSSQLTDTLTPATNYCASIADVGNLREAANFSIRIESSMTVGFSDGEKRTTRLRRTTISAWHLVWVALALVAVSCGSDASPTAPTTPTTPGNETWSGVLAPGGASSRSFSVAGAGTITVTLTDAGTTVGLGVGLPRVTGGGCRLGVSVTATGGASPQISTQADAGQYCVQVFDLGTLTDPVGFALKISHP